VPSLGDEEIREVVDSLRSNWLTTGPKVARFEAEFAAFVGADAALAVGSCTHAMQVALAALGVGPGDEVITSAMTFVSTVHVIERVGATPVLVDVDPETLTIDVASVERAVTPRTRVILPVHLYGHPCEMDALRSIAVPRGIRILEDAAHALPATYKGTTIGAAGSLAAFSFYAIKNMTTGEGGMLVGPRDLIERARMWSLHGMSRDAFSRYSVSGSWFYDVLVPGFKCNMTDLQASLGLPQLRKLPKFQQRRRTIWRQYNAAFAGVPQLQIPIERSEVESALHLYVIRLNLDRLSIDRDRFINELRDRNIGTSVHFIPIHLHRYYRDKYGYQPHDYPVALTNFQRMLSLPLNAHMSDDDVEDVLWAVGDVVRQYGR
jgi:dTDP-4-amino-4,6-dideoxygalactose transaminase